MVKTSQAGLAVRIQFKVALYDEFRQDWRSAVNNYRLAYDQLTASLNQFQGACLGRAAHLPIRHSNRSMLSDLARVVCIVQSLMLCP